MNMWKPNVKLSTWFKLYPSLEAAYPVKCRCGKLHKDVVPYVSKYYIGIKCGKCDCGVSGQSISVPRNESCNKRMTELLKSQLKINL